MTGFVVDYKGKCINASLENGGFYVLISYARGSTNVSVRGLDQSRMAHVIWLDEALKEGDAVTVKIAGVGMVSELVGSHPQNREELVARYHKLKAELQEEGLL